MELPARQASQMRPVDISAWLDDAPALSGSAGKSPQQSETEPCSKFRLPISHIFVLYSVLLVLVVAVSLGVLGVVSSRQITDTMFDTNSGNVMKHIEDVFSEFESGALPALHRLINITQADYWTFYNPSLRWCHDGAIPRSFWLAWEVLMSSYPVFAITWRTNVNQTVGSGAGMSSRTMTFFCTDQSASPNWIYYNVSNTTFTISSGTPTLKPLPRAIWPTTEGIRMYKPSLYMSGGLMTPLIAFGHAFPERSGAIYHDQVNVNFNVERLKDMAKKLKISDGSRVIIILDDGSCLALSDNSTSIWNLSTLVMKKMHTLDDRVLSTIGKAILMKYDSYANISTSFSLEILGDTIFLKAFKYQFNVISPTILTIVMTPKKDVLGGVLKHQTTTIAIVVALTAASLIIAVPTSWAIGRKLVRMSQMMDNLAKFDFTALRLADPERISREASLLKEISQVQASYVTVEKRMMALTRFLPERLCDNIISGLLPARLGANKTVAVTLKASILGLPEHIAKLAPEEIPSFVNSIAACLEFIAFGVRSSNGAVDKFLGGGLMAFWNSVCTPSEYNEIVVAMLRTFDLRASANQPTKCRCNFRFTIGISSGEVLLGNFGTTRKFSYTTIGDCVQEAERLQEYATQFGANICISESIKTQVAPTILCRLVRHADLVQKKGSAVFEPVGEHTGVSGSGAKMVESYEYVLTQFETNVKGALKRAREHCTTFPEDSVGAELLSEYLDRKKRRVVWQVDTSALSLSNAEAATSPSASSATAEDVPIDLRSSQE